MVSSNKAVVVVPGVVEMGPPPSGELPKQAIVWKVDVRLDGGEIDLRYNGVAVHDLTTRTIEDYLAAVVDQREPQQWTQPREPVPGKTPLSIHHQGYSYMVFVLEKRNWQFSEGRVPFMIESGKEAFYMDAKCAWRDRGGALRIEAAARAGESCKTACFIADARSDQSTSGGGDFLSSFNIYLDFRLKRSDGGLRLLPIAIDPDVGHPGGSEP